MMGPYGYMYINHGAGSQSNEDVLQTAPRWVKAETARALVCLGSSVVLVSVVAVPRLKKEGNGSRSSSL